MSYIWEAERPGVRTKGCTGCPTSAITGLVLIQADIRKQLSTGLSWVKNSVISLHSSDWSALGLACCFPKNASIVKYLLTTTK